MAWVKDDDSTVNILMSPAVVALRVSKCADVGSTGITKTGPLGPAALCLHSWTRWSTPAVVHVL